MWLANRFTEQEYLVGVYLKFNNNKVTYDIKRKKKENSDDPFWCYFDALIIK